MRTPATKATTRFPAFSREPAKLKPTARSSRSSSRELPRNPIGRKDVAERVGFEPTLEFPLNTLSQRAPSATRPSLRRGVAFNSLAHANGFRILQPHPRIHAK